MGTSVVNNISSRLKVKRMKINADLILLFKCKKIVTKNIAEIVINVIKIECLKY